ncbi:hypothetical protein MKY04_04610 [Lysinibacillus telephonicus]|uniref:hypothetical protein n=1 Tax=Lysinibacillus telephonicus TaxID=1714840 RepID=UPI0031FBE30E
MNFKRQEGFRFVFNEAIDAKIKLKLNGRDINFEPYECKIIDISPSVFCKKKVQRFAINYTECCHPVFLQFLR